MLRWKYPGLRRAAVCLLVVLLLVPGLLHEHRHAVSHPCAVCVVAKHSPAVGTRAPGMVAPLFHALAPPRTPVIVAPARDLPVRPGRAPPPGPAAHFA